MGTKKSNPVIKDGALGIILIGKSERLCDQKFLLTRDRNDRGRGDGLRMYGLPGGTIEFRESPEEAFVREMYEETSLRFRWGLISKFIWIFFRKRSFNLFGCYQKARQNGYVNDNYLFVANVDHINNLITNDEKEVSEICVLNLWDIIELLQKGKIHEGSTRLIFHYLSGSIAGSLNQNICFNSIRV